MGLRVSTPKTFSYLEPHCYARKLPVYIQTHDIGECHPFNLVNSQLRVCFFFFFLKQVFISRSFLLVLVVTIMCWEVKKESKC